MKTDHIQDKIIEEYEQFSNKSYRSPYFRKLIQMDDDLVPIPNDKLDKEREVKTSKSNIWIKANLLNNNVFFTAESDNPIRKEFVGLLLREN